MRLISLSIINFLFLLNSKILFAKNENQKLVPKLPSMASRLSLSGIHFFSLIGHKIVRSFYIECLNYKF